MVTGLSPVEPAPAMPASPRSPVSPHAPATALDIPAVQPVPAQAHHAASLPSARVRVPEVCGEQRADLDSREEAGDALLGEELQDLTAPSHDPLLADGVGGQHVVQHPG